MIYPVHSYLRGKEFELAEANSASAAKDLRVLNSKFR